MLVTADKSVRARRARYSLALQSDICALQLCTGSKQRRLSRRVYTAGIKVSRKYADPRGGIEIKMLTICHLRRHTIGATLAQELVKFALRELRLAM
jgi:hypothetical protein